MGLAAQFIFTHCSAGPRWVILCMFVWRSHMQQLVWQANDRHLVLVQACGTGGADQWPLGQGMQDLLQSICDDAIRVTFHFHSQIWSTVRVLAGASTAMVRTSPALLSSRPVI